jgi:DNA-binding transcriptional MerR regulator
MPDDPYSLTDLARLADVTPRTIRYYVSQGLLPSPDAAGPATRYGEGHLLRLRLIRRLQRDHLPLAEIRARLEQMGDEAVRMQLEQGGTGSAPPPAAAPAETLAFVRDLMAQANVQPRATRPSGGSLLRRVGEYRPSIPDGYPLRSDPGPAPAPSTPLPSMPAIAPSVPVAPGPRSVAGDRSTWERLVITQDVELHVRRPLDRRSNKKVEQLVRIARELFDEET